jgi:hypothetical protein
VALRLADLDRALEPVELPNGRVVPVKEMDAGAFELYEILKGDEGDTAVALELMERVLPDAKPDEIRSLTPAMMQGVLMIAAGKIAQVHEMIAGNAVGTAVEQKAKHPRPRRRPSSPATLSATSSPA